MAGKQATREQKLEWEAQRATWERTSAEEDLRGALKLVVDRMESFLTDTKRGVEQVISRLEGREEKPFSSTADRASWLTDYLRNFLSNQFDVVRSVEQAARKVEAADRMLEVLNLVKAGE